jgi:hypothetical protein
MVKVTTSSDGWPHPANTSVFDVALILRISPHLISCHFEIPLLDNALGGDLGSSSKILPTLQDLVLHGAALRPLLEWLDIPSE